MKTLMVLFSWVLVCGFSYGDEKKDVEGVVVRYMEAFLTQDWEGMGDTMHPKMFVDFKEAWLADNLPKDADEDFRKSVDTQQLLKLFGADSIEAVWAMEPKMVFVKWIGLAKTLKIPAAEMMPKVEFKKFEVAEDKGVYTVKAHLKMKREEEVTERVTTFEVEKDGEKFKVVSMKR